MADNKYDREDPPDQGQPSPDQGGDDTLDIAKLEADLAASVRESSEMKELAQRTAAEFHNYKARVAREKTDLRRFTVCEVVRSMLPVLDNLERATASADAVNADALLTGVRMVVDQFRRALDENGVRPVVTEGALLDPTCMEAIARVETSDVPENRVVEAFEKGYKLADLVVRPARVTVAAAPRKREADGGTGPRNES